MAVYSPPFISLLLSRSLFLRSPPPPLPHSLLSHSPLSPTLFNDDDGFNNASLWALHKNHTRLIKFNQNSHQLNLLISFQSEIQNGCFTSKPKCLLSQQDAKTLNVVFNMTNIVLCHHCGKRSILVSQPGILSGFRGDFLHWETNQVSRQLRPEDYQQASSVINVAT